MTTFIGESRSVRGMVLCYALVASLLTFTIVMSFSIRKDLAVDAIKVRDTQQLPSSQTLVKAGISYDPADNTIVYSDGNRVYSVGSSNPNSMVVFSPGYTGSSPSIFSDWEELCAVLPSMIAPKFIYFDNSFTAAPETALVIPEGDWDMTGVIWKRDESGYQNAGDLSIAVTVTDGATLNGLRGIDGPIIVSYTSNAQPAIEIDYTQINRYSGFFLYNFATIQNLGTSPFMNINTTITFTVTLRTGILQGTSVFHIETGTLVMQLFSNSFVTANTISGSLGSTINMVPRTPDNFITIPLNYPLVLGTFVLTNANIAKCPNMYSRATTPIATDDASKGYKVGDQWVDTVGDDFYYLVDSTNNAAVWKGPL